LTPGRGSTPSRAEPDGQVLAGRAELPLEEFRRLVGKSPKAFLFSGWHDRLRFHRMEGRWMVPSSAIHDLITSWMGSSRSAKASPPDKLSLFLTALYSFYLDHRQRCGELDGGIEGDRIWLTVRVAPPLAGRWRLLLALARMLGLSSGVD